MPAPTAPAAARLATRLLLATAFLLGGAATAIAAVAVHPYWWGLLLGLAATVATVIAIPPGGATRLAYAGGWAAMLAYLAVPRGEGDYVISRSWAGYTLLVAALVLVVAAIVTLPRPGAGPGRASAP